MIENLYTYGLYLAGMAVICAFAGLFTKKNASSQYWYVVEVLLGGAVVLMGVAIYNTPENFNSQIWVWLVLAFSMGALNIGRLEDNPTFEEWSQYIRLAIGLSVWLAIIFILVHQQYMENAPCRADPSTCKEIPYIPTF